MPWSRIAGLVACLVLPLAYADEPETVSQTETGAAAKPAPEYQTESIRGRVVWLADALKREFGISTVSEAAESALALHTSDGRLLPIVENVRGRAFRKDARLLHTDMEIVARRYQKHPLIQILRVYEIEQGRKYEVDYWCDVCAIVMFETGPCSCCQDDNRLRKRLVQDRGEVDASP